MSAPRVPNTPGAGMGVDASGGPVVDPTANVIALVIAEAKRQDDLREAHDRYIQARLDSIEQIAEIREGAAERLRETETKRVDAVRQVDQLAVSTAAERSQAAIQALAATTSSNAENVRTALTNTAATIAAQLATTVSQINERISTLERSSYETKGKSAVADPALDRMAALVERLTAAQSVGTGKTEGIGLSWGVLLGALGAIGGIVALVLNLGG